MYRTRFFGRESITLLITLPIWMPSELVRPRQRPVTNVVAVFVVAATFLPILIAYRMTKGTETMSGADK